MTEFRGPLWPFDSWESSTEGCRNELVVLRSMMTIITRGCCKLVSRALPTCLVFQMLLAAATSALSEPSRVAEIATYRGADRELRLIEGAKREGELMFYTSILVDDLAAVGAAFERRYGIKVKSWRADSESFLRRIVAESRARRYEVDVMHGAGAALEALYREDLLQEVKSPYIADLMPEAMPPHRQWAPMILNMIVQAYNTKIVQKEALPASYRDLLKPDWRGKLGIEADDYDWFAQIVTELGEPEGLKLFHQIATTTGISVRKGAFRIDQPRRSGRGGARTHDLWFRRRSGESQGRAARLVCNSACGGAASAGRAGAICTTSLCRCLVLRFFAQRRAADIGKSPVCRCKQEGGVALHEGAAHTY